jgi:hypothetical protein
MSARTAQAAAQSDPVRNYQFSRGWIEAYQEAGAPPGIRVWHAEAEPRMSPQRAAAERFWGKLTRGVRP